MVIFHCWSCGRRIRAANKYKSRHGKCPKCRAHIVVPNIKKPFNGFWRDLVIALLGGLLALVIEYKSGVFNQSSPDDTVQQESLRVLKQISNALQYTKINY